LVVVDRSLWLVIGTGGTPQIGCNLAGNCRVPAFRTIGLSGTRATAFSERFFACGETALTSSPALD